MPADTPALTGPLAGIGDEAAVRLGDQIDAVRALGWHAIELRTVDGTPLAELPPARFREAAALLRDAGLDVVCLASRIGNWGRPVTAPFAADLAELDALAAQCAVLGCRYVRIMSYPNDGLAEADWAARAVDRVARLARRAERLGVTLLHENCAGWAGDSAERALRLLAEAGGPALRLLFDTGNGVPYGYPAPAMLERLLPHVAHVHIKDAVRTDAGTGTAYTLPGDGAAGVADCLRLLAAAGYTGALSLEPHLAAQPHAGLSAGGDAAALFVRAGRRLEQLLAALERTAAPVPAPGTPRPGVPA